MNLGCFLDPGGCISTTLTAWVNWFPFGAYGLMFAAGMIVGAILGRWGVAAVFVALAALKVASKNEPEQFPHEDPKPVPAPKKRKTLF